MYLFRNFVYLLRGKKSVWPLTLLLYLENTGQSPTALLRDEPSVWRFSEICTKPGLSNNSTHTAGSLIAEVSCVKRRSQSIRDAVEPQRKGGTLKRSTVGESAPKRKKKGKTRGKRRINGREEKKRQPVTGTQIQCNLGDTGQGSASQGPEALDEKKASGKIALDGAQHDVGSAHGCSSPRPRLSNSLIYFAPHEGSFFFFLSSETVLF